MAQGKLEHALCMLLKAVRACDDQECLAWGPAVVVMIDDLLSIVDVEMDEHQVAEWAAAVDRAVATAQAGRSEERPAAER